MKDVVPITSSKRKVEVKGRVLEVRVVTGKGGGPEKTILNTPRYMNPFGYKTLCAYMRPPEDDGFQVILNRAKELDCEILDIPDRGMFDRSVSKRLLELCREHEITLWHGHDYKSNVLGLWLRRKHPMKLVTTVHGWVNHTWKTPLYYLLDRWSLRHYDHVICVSHDLYDRCLRLGVPKEKCSLIENAIDTKQYSRTLKREDAKAKFGFPQDRIVLGGVGRLSPEKNFAGLIRVVAKLLDENLPLSLYIAGDGPIQDSLQRLIDSTGHADQIHLTGFCANIQEFYQGLDLFVLNSLREGLPNVVLEAMAYEVPVLSTRVAGVPRLITNGYNGVLVDIQRDDQLETMLRTLVAETDYRQMIGNNGHMTILKQYNFGMRMKKIRDIYDAL